MVVPQGKAANCVLTRTPFPRKHSTSGGRRYPWNQVPLVWPAGDKFLNGHGNRFTYLEPGNLFCLRTSQRFVQQWLRTVSADVLGGKVCTITCHMHSAPTGRLLSMRSCCCALWEPWLIRAEPDAPQMARSQGLPPFRICLPQRRPMWARILPRTSD